MVEDDSQFGARLIMEKVSAQETVGAKIAYSLTVHSNFTYTVHAQENLPEVSRTTLLQHLPTSVSTLSSMTTIVRAIDSSVILECPMTPSPCRETVTEQSGPESAAEKGKVRYSIYTNVSR